MPKIRDNKIAYGLKNLSLSLKSDQHDASQLIDKYDIVILSGKAGTGKTLVAVFKSLELLHDKKIEKIIITRPTVAGEDLGFLPGGINEKMEPWIAPVIENIETVIGPEETKKLMDDKVIQIKPIAYMRGQTFMNAAIIVDEAQNVTHEQTEMVLGRLGRKSKMMICGDIRQRDLENRKFSGFPFLLELSQKINDIGHKELITNHRHSVVDKILDYYQCHSPSKSSQQHQKIGKSKKLSTYGKLMSPRNNFEEPTITHDLSFRWKSTVA